VRLAGLAHSAFRSMGTRVSVLSGASDAAVAAPAVRSVFEAWDARFSRFRPDSELSRLNAAVGSRFAASELMIDVVAASLDAARLTDGLFDPALLGRLRELGYDASFELLPADRPVTPLAAWRPGAWREIELDRGAGSIRLPAGTALDLGGIAKGMAVDAAIDTLRAAGVRTAAVNAGGDLAVIGPPPDRESWPIAIDGAGERSVLLRQGALATSSVLRRRWRVGGKERHHLLDPRTGMPAAGRIASASVAAATCRAAEVAAKVALLLGPREAALFLARHRLSGLLVLHDASTWRLGDWQAAA
jgi:thiamine biosynthesis lipoprotein